MIVSPALVLSLVSVVPPPASAHHSIAPFDEDTFVELEGTIKELHWRNPHVTFTLVVAGDSGQQQEWGIEGDSANAMRRRGLTREAVMPGTPVRIAGWPSLLGRQEIFGINILLPSREEIIMTDLDYPLRWTDPHSPGVVSAGNLGRSIFRTWSGSALYAPREPFVYTETAQRARAQWDPYTDTLALRCIPPGMPNAILNPYPIEFIDEGDQIRLRIEEWEAERIIHMMPAEVPADAPRSRLGYSIGQWEGDALVVRTSNVDFSYLDDEGTPMSESAEMIERFTVSEDGLDLAFEITVTDPQNLLAPAVWDAAWKWVPGAQIRPFECEL